MHWRGAHDAVLWGGNLCVITSLLGTPYFPQIEGGVLFLEDIGEHPYRVERMLDQLRLAGVLGRQRAILLGQFTGTRPTSHDRGFSMKTVSSRLAAQLKVSVLEGLPFGHVSTKITLPIGATIDMAMEGREAVLVWGHQHAHGD